jgi:glutamate carboxypeptidase
MTVQPTAQAAADPIADTLGIPPDEARSRLLERVRRYVEHETPSGDETALTNLAGVIRRDLEAIGMSVDSLPAPGFGVNLLATLPAAANDAEPARSVVILTHIDTVHPKGTLLTQPFRVLEDRAEGPGGYDMKCGLSIAIEALSLLRESGRSPARTVRLLVTCDEEIGSHSSHEHIVSLAGEAAAVLVPEPAVGGGAVKTARKGVTTYELRTIGSAAHAGIEPGRAVSAITEMAHQIRAILELANHDVGTTINIGTISGGTASNVVAAAAHATIDVRSVEQEEARRVREALQGLQPYLPGARVEVQRTEERPPLERTPAVVAVYEHARGLAAGLGVELGEGASGGGSDGSIAAAAGAPTLDGLGPDGGGAHAADEHILLADLPFRVALWMRLLETL